LHSVEVTVALLPKALTPDSNLKLETGWADKPKGQEPTSQMTNSVSSVRTHDRASQASQPTTRPPQPKPPSFEVNDKVTLKSTAKSASTGDHHGNNNKH